MQIEQVLSKNDIILSKEAVEKLYGYHKLLCEKNKVMDLTNVPIQDIPLRHYVDSLLPLVQYKELFPNAISLIDVGTGAGLPGIPFAIAREDMKVTLLETQRKRCDFLQEVAEKVDLLNVEVIHMRAEDGGKHPQYREMFDVAIARALAPLNVLAEYLLPFVKVGGVAIALKGPNVFQECQEAKNAVALLGGAEPVSYNIALEDQQHTLAVIEKKKITPEIYPRRRGIPTKRPL